VSDGHRRVNIGYNLQPAYRDSFVANGTGLSSSTNATLWLAVVVTAQYSGHKRNKLSVVVLVMQFCLLIFASFFYDANSSA